MNNWEEYLGGDRKVKGPLSLFPRIEGHLSPNDLTEMERDRFRWLLTIYPGDPNHLFNLWSNRNFLMDERSSRGDLNLERFYAASEGLGSYLLREEVRQVSYLNSLKTCLALRVASGDPVLFFGPTSGADLEAIHAAGGMPHLISIVPDPKWEEIAELRLWDCRIPFEDVDIRNILSTGSRYIVISSWITEPDTYMRLAVEAVGKYGFILTPSTNLLAVHESKKLYLQQVDTFQSDVSVWYKPLNSCEDRKSVV
jgi:hypothetical protein